MTEPLKDQFSDIAAHELRASVQRILALNEAIRSKIKEPTQKNLLDVIVRNAKWLQELKENILDVTKIQSHSFDLKMDLFNLNYVIINTIDDIIANFVKSPQGDLIKNSV